MSSIHTYSVLSKFNEHFFLGDIFPEKPLKIVIQARVVYTINVLMYLLMCMIKVEGISNISRFIPAFVLPWQLYSILCSTSCTIKDNDIIPVTEYKVICS